MNIMIDKPFLKAVDCDSELAAKPEKEELEPPPPPKMGPPVAPDG
jgi:hypothetical protein